MKTLTPGWQKRRRDNFVALTSGGYQDEDLVGDGWTDVARNAGAFGDAQVPDGSAIAPDELKRIKEMADFKKMKQIRARVDAIVKDQKTAAALQPWYRQFCKRPCFNDEYLPTFNRRNVTLVNTDGRGPDRFTEQGIAFDGVEYAVDCVVFATGFEYGNAYSGFSLNKGHPIHGRNGKSLAAEWNKGLRTLHGFYSHDFPNLFHMGATQNGSAFAVTYCLDEQAEHIADVLRKAQLREANYIEPTADAEAAWVAVIREKSHAVCEFLRECTPGYFNNEGRIGDSSPSRAEEVYGGGPIEFYDLIRRWRDGGMEGLVLSRKPRPASATITAKCKPSV